MDTSPRRDFVLAAASGAAVVGLAVLAPVLLPWSLLRSSTGKGHGVALMLGAVGLGAWTALLDHLGCARPWIVLVPAAVAAAVAALVAAARQRG